MRHCLNLFLGDSCSHLALDVLKYVVQYGGSTTSGYVQSRGVKVDGDGVQVFEALRRKVADTFTMEYGSEWTVEAGEPEHVKGVDGWLTLLSDCHSHTITIGNPGDSSRLLVTLCLLVSDVAAMRAAADIIQAAYQLNGMFEVDVLMLSEDVGHSVFAMPLPADAGNDMLRDAALSFERDGGVSHIVAISGRNSDGVSLNMTSGTLIRLLSIYCTLCAEQYTSVFNLADDNDPTRRVIVPGLSVLEFDRSLLVNYLLNRTYRSVLESENVGQKTVDINTAAMHAHQLVSRHKEFLSNFWREHIQPMIKRGMSAGEIAGKADQPLTEAVSNIEAEITALLARRDLSLPEKQCVMALLLGEDDPLLSGQLFNEEQLYIEDIDTEAVTLFAGESTIDKLRQLKRDIQRSTSFLRQKTSELEGLDLKKEEEEGEQKQRHLSDGGFSWGGYTYRLTAESEEKPLASTYMAKKTNVKSVDLRQFFTPVRNQGTQGSCSAHSGVAVMEYLLKKNKEPNPDLSEAFVYYNTRRRRGEQTIDSGATIFDMLSALQDDGVCAERLCRYDVSKVSEKPSAEAYADGLKHRVITAKNVNLTVADFRSALAAGLPIIISMKMYESFDAPKGFIRRPSSKDRPGGQGNHAMVVCGYSDKDRIFIVRNSWGKHFGSKGYCYMPYSFVEKENMLSMAAVITATNMTNIKVEGLDSNIAVTFDEADASIRGELLKLLIEDERTHLAELAHEYKQCREIYDEVILSQGSSQSRSEALDNELDKLNAVFNSRQSELDKLQRERQEQTSLAETKDKRDKIIAAIGYAIYFLLQALGHGFTSFFVYVILIGIGVLIWYVIEVISERRKIRLRKRFDSKIAEAIKLVEEQKRKIDLLRVKATIYGMALNKSQRMQTRLKQQYRASCAYMGHLTTWLQNEQKRATEIAYNARAPFISCISLSHLDEFFEQRRQQIVGDTRLSDYLRDHISDEAGIEQFKLKLKQRIAAVLESVCADFSMLRYIMGIQSFAYLPPPEAVAQLMPALGRKGVPFLPIRDSALNGQVDFAVFIHSDSQDERGRWEQESGRYFTFRPMQNDLNSPTVLILLQLRRIDSEDIK